MAHIPFGYCIEGGHAVIHKEQAARFTEFVRLYLGGISIREAAERAADGVRKKIAADGTVEGVSYGTPMGMDLDFYRKVPLQATAYGQGLAYLMFMEMGR